MPLYDTTTTEFVVLRSERIGTNRLILHGSAVVLDGVMVSALARKARGTGSIPGPG